MPGPTYHSSVRQIVQMVKESTHGGGGTATTRMAGLKFPYWSATGTFQDVVPSGFTIPTTKIHGREWSTSPVSGMMIYGDLIPIFDSSLIFATPTGGPTYTRVWTPVASAENAFASYFVVAGDAGVAYSYKYAHADSFSLSFSPDSSDVGGQWIGQVEDPTATLAGSPTMVEAIPVEPGNGGLWVATTGFAGTYSRLAGSFKLDIDFQNFRNRVFTLDDSIKSYTDTVSRLAGAKVKLAIAADKSGSDYYGPFTLAGWRASTTIYLRYLNVFDASHSLQIDMALQLENPVKSDDQDVFTLTSDAGFVVGDTSKFIEITLISKQASI